MSCETDFLGVNMDESWLAQYPEFERDHFWWRVRRDLVEQEVEAHSRGRVLRVLDIGCGSGETIYRLSKRHDVLGIEHDPRAVADSRIATNITVAAVESMQFDSGSFDVVLMLDVLEHLDDPIKVLCIVRGWIDPGGILIVTVPAHGWLWTRFDEVNDHRTRYRRPELASELSSSGWNPTLVRYLFAALLIPKVMQLLFERLRLSSDASRPVMPRAWVNRAAHFVLRAESAVALGPVGRWWVGTSLIGIARPTEPNTRSLGS